MATLKLLLGFAIFGFTALVLFKLIPPIYSNYQFEDSIRNEAMQSTYSTRTEDEIRASVVKSAHSFDIELDPKQVHVVRVGTQASGSCTISADYSVPLDIPGYSTTLDFHPSTKNKGVLN